MSKIIEMARQAGMRFSTTGSPTVAIELVGGHVRELERFAALVAKAERERCAKSCEELYVGKFHPMLHRGPLRSAAAIRALGDEVSE